MRVVYFLRGAQILLAFACIYRLIAVDELCSTQEAELFESRHKRDIKAVALPADPDYSNIKAARKMIVRSLDQQEKYLKGEAESTEKGETEHTTKTTEKIETEEATTGREETKIRKEEMTAKNQETTTGMATTEREENSSMTGEFKHEPELQNTEETSEMEHLTLEPTSTTETKPHNAGKLEVKKTEETEKIVTQRTQFCKKLTARQILTSKGFANGLLSLLSWSTFVFLLMIDVFLVEIVFVFLSRKEYNKRGAFISGLAHIALVIGAEICLIVFRLNWTDHWLLLSSYFVPAYPSNWLWVEYAAWVLLISHILEMILYRATRAEIVLRTDTYSSYNVAAREEGRIYPCNTQPFDGSYEL